MKTKPKKKKSHCIVLTEYFLFRLFALVINILPLTLAYRLSYIIAFWVFWLDKKHRNRTIQHLIHAGMANNHRSATHLALCNFKSYGRMAVDAFKVNQQIGTNNYSEYISIQASKKAKDTLFGDQAVIALSLHSGNFMFSATAFSILTSKEILSVIRPYDNYRIEEYIQKVQLKYGHNTCYKDGALRPLLKSLKKNVSIGMLVDQHAGKGTGIDTTFFYQPCKTHATPAVLHLKTGIPICVICLLQGIKPGTFEFVIKDPIIFEPTGDMKSDTRKVAQLYTDLYEEIIKEKPEQWFWCHRRWTNINRKGEVDGSKQKN